MGAGHGHSHANENRSFWAAVITGGFMLAEVVGGLVAGSLALLADAAHMATDALALALAWFAFRVARRPASWRKTYGYGRFQVLVAFGNGLTLFLLTIVIGIEAFQRLWDPVDVLGGPMLVIALAGLGVNVAAFFILQGADTKNLNIRGAVLHVLGDLLGSVAALIAAVVILLTGWDPIDPILSAFVCLILLRSAWMLVRDSTHILLEGVPEGLDPRELARSIENLDGAEDVHHVHVWALNDDKPLVTLHVRKADSADSDTLLDKVLKHLSTEFGIAHAAVQIEHGPCPEDGRMVHDRPAVAGAAAE